MLRDNRLVLSSTAGIALAVVSVGCHGGSSATPEATKAAISKGATASRRNVKTTTDHDASKIDPAAKETTIEDILTQKGPADGKLAGRSAPFETSTWRVKATLMSVKLMKDGDYYLVMKGDKGGQTVVEVPDPKECKGSPLATQISAARKQIEEKYHPTSEVKEIHDSATVTGVGFLGFGNKKPGKGPSGPRLMPGLGFEFGK